MTVYDTPRAALDAAATHYGSQTAMAEALGVTPQAVSLWFAKGHAPLERARYISDATGIPAIQLVDPRIAQITVVS